MSNRGVLVSGWHFTGHALQRCAEMRLDLADVLGVLDCPTQTYPSDAQFGPNRRLAVGHGVVVAHNPTSGTVITVLWDRAEGRNPDGTPSL